MNFLVTIRKEPLGRRHTWNSMTDIEKGMVVNIEKCSMPSDEFLKALQEECDGKFEQKYKY